MRDFDPLTWYAIVGDSQTHVFSFATGDYVPIEDKAYQAWLAEDPLPGPSRIGTEEELGQFLAKYFARPTAEGVLDAYKERQATKLTVEIVAKVTFNHENRIRALEGKQPINAAQFKSALKDLM